jgi:hypothetical protein
MISQDLSVQAMLKLMHYCESEEYKGWDPYDGLNSKLFQSTPLKHWDIARLVLIQTMKRSPVNLRKLLLIPKMHNPKGIGLFLNGYCNLYRMCMSGETRFGTQEELLLRINDLAELLISLKSEGYSGSCWGYNFDWQNRAFFLPSGTPTVVATTFISYALMDAYDITGKSKYLKTALSSTQFILNDLNRTEKEKGFIFSYSPFDTTRVYNASLLGSRLLARAYNYTNDDALIDAARKSVIACTDVQRNDGAWKYGEHEVQTWVDSFHTGYNLECISEYQKYSGDSSFQINIDKGMNFYLNHFFLDNGTPKYYDSKVYPIDIHAPAQFFVTTYRLNQLTKNRELIEKVLSWTISHMQNKKSGYFYYQLKKGISSKIPYMRWAQAWMFYGLSFYLLNTNELNETKG